MREREIAERRKTTDLIAAAREAEREALRLTRKAEAEKEPRPRASPRPRGSPPQGEAEAEKIKARGAAAALRGRRQGRDAAQRSGEHAAAAPARLSRFRGKLLERIEGIVRESVRPMEKIEAIKILHIDGANGGGRRQPQRHRRSHRFRLALPRSGADDRQPDERDRHRRRQAWGA